MIVHPSEPITNELRCCQEYRLKRDGGSEYSLFSGCAGGSAYLFSLGMLQDAHIDNNDGDFTSQEGWLGITSFPCFDFLMGV